MVQLLKPGLGPTHLNNVTMFPNFVTCGFLKGAVRSFMWPSTSVTSNWLSIFASARSLTVPVLVEIDIRGFGLQVLSPFVCCFQCQG